MSRLMSEEQTETFFVSVAYCIIILNNKMRNNGDYSSVSVGAQTPHGVSKAL
jgi:hypothetical protein